MPRGAKANSKALSSSDGISIDLLMIGAALVSGCCGRARTHCSHLGRARRARIGLPKNSTESI